MRIRTGGQAALVLSVRRAAIPASASRNLEISSSVVEGPIETRKAPSSAANPMALRTWLGPTRPDEQADPAESATPARSKAICAVSALTPGIAKKVVFASLGADRP
jgi:hypothetical protein